MALIYAQSFDIPTSGWGDTAPSFSVVNISKRRFPVQKSNVIPTSFTVETPSFTISGIKKREMPVRRPRDNFYTEEGEVYFSLSEPFTIPKKTVPFPLTRLQNIPENTPWGDNVFNFALPFRNDYSADNVISVIFGDRDKGIYPYTQPFSDEYIFEEVVPIIFHEQNQPFSDEYIFEEVVPIIFHEQNQTFFIDENIQEFTIAKLKTYAPPRVLTTHMVEMDLLENMSFWGMLLTNREYLSVLKSPYIHVGTKINRTIYPRSAISVRGRSQKTFW